jgi:hypothetical protein
MNGCVPKGVTCKYVYHLQVRIQQEYLHMPTLTQAPGNLTVFQQTEEGRWGQLESPWTKYWMDKMCSLCTMK